MTIIPCSRRMGHDITTDGLFLVASIWTCSRVWTGHDLIRYDHSNTKLTENWSEKNDYSLWETNLICQPLEGPQELAQMILPR